MRNLLMSVLIVFVVLGNSRAQEIAPYIKVGESTESLKSVSDEVISALKDNGFLILGSYNPAKKSNLKVIVFTRSDVTSKVIKVLDRGALAAPFKVGLVSEEGKVTISYTNPDYIFRAYLRDNYNSYKTTFTGFAADIKKALSPLGSEFVPFGGGVKADKLKKYHYKIMMPYFTDPVELAEFSSFEDGLKIIKENLSSNKGNTKLVYELVYNKAEVAVFGVGLLDPEEGEGHFLPKIGEKHVAALPYEMILQGNQLTMLHGKYRIALHWPELTMGTFMKIMSTPGDIKDALEDLSEIE
ncbi:MAG: hypothetical protein KJO49_13245 [Bacteroidia bacterium]|nr:hypothetical protein [Bacteroidia bacterium]NNK69155.1 hypothetical protein [Flavobacteriaceae bacterium]